MTVTLSFDRRPSVVAYHLRALLPSSGLGPRGFPPIRARWRGHRLDASYLDELLRLTDLRGARGCEVFFPHVFGFPLQMAIITHQAFPLSIWKALQIRNSFLQHLPLPRVERIDLETAVADQRVLEKGAEVDLYTTVHSHGALIWEGLSTFYYRGRFGVSAAPAPSAKAPEVPSCLTAEWDTEPGGEVRFAALSGDYNGIHRWSWYARLFGFRQAFFHPQRVLGQCLARLAAPCVEERQRLDVWIKGPVYYGSRVALDAGPDGDGMVFALRATADPRPAMVGRWSSPRASATLKGAPPDPSRMCP